MAAAGSALLSPAVCPCSTFLSRSTSSLRQPPVEDNLEDVRCEAGRGSRLQARSRPRGFARSVSVTSGSGHDRSFGCPPAEGADPAPSDFDHDRDRGLSPLGGCQRRSSCRPTFVCWTRFLCSGKVEGRCPRFVVTAGPPVPRGQGEPSSPAPDRASASGVRSARVARVPGSGHAGWHMMAHGDANASGVAKIGRGVRKTGRGVAFGRCNETLGLTRSCGPCRSDRRSCPPRRSWRRCPQPRRPATFRLPARPPALPPGPLGFGGTDSHDRMDLIEHKVNGAMVNASIPRRTSGRAAPQEAPPMQRMRSTTEGTRAPQKSAINRDHQAPSVDGLRLCLLPTRAGWPKPYRSVRPKRHGKTEGTQKPQESWRKAAIIVGRTNPAPGSARAAMASLATASACRCGPERYGAAAGTAGLQGARGGSHATARDGSSVHSE
jgi:hypothetical protein